MRFPTFMFPIMALVFVNTLTCLSQTVASEPTASISGRVTIAGKAAAGIRVVASTSKPFDKRIVGKATTDQDGNYRITGVVPGQLTVSPVAKAFVNTSSSGAQNNSSRSLSVSAGEEITSIDFKLIRGGVITGRVTDADGSPLIRETVTILPTLNQETGHTPINRSPNSRVTDDRGIYRIYGLLPGTYKVRVGQTKPDSRSGMFRTGSQYMQTFYPGVPDESKATVIELKEGAEVKDIDIRTTKGVRGFTVSGRVVDSTSNQAAAGVYVGYSAVEDSQQGMGGMNFTPIPTDVTGKFTLEGLQPGQYLAYTFGVALDNGTYSEGTRFEVMDADVSGVEIKLSRGASLSGVAVIEGDQDPEIAAVLQTVSLAAFADRKSVGPPSMARSAIKPDGSFKFTGLAPGKIRIMTTGFPSSPKGLTILRIEAGGIEQRDGIEVAAGGEITGVRLVFTYGSGSIKGTIKVSGATPEGAIFWVSLSPEGSGPMTARRSATVDSRGHFFAEELPAGTYELTVYGQQSERELPGFKPVKQIVTINKGSETQVTVNIDLDQRRN